LLPSMELRGAVNRDALPAAGPGVREGSREDLELCAAVDDAIRGGSRSADLEMLLDAGSQLWVSERPRGYALLLGTRAQGLAAEDEATARALLLTMLAEAPAGEELSVSWITAPNQWAIQTGLAAGLRLQNDGPV